jgi:hypothetical protein
VATVITGALDDFRVQAWSLAIAPTYRVLLW